MKKFLFIFIILTAVVSLSVCDWDWLNGKEETVRRHFPAYSTETEDDEDEELTAEDEKGIRDALNGWIGSCPWTSWQSSQNSDFKVSYPYFMQVVKKQTQGNCLVVKWHQMKMVAKIYKNNMSVEEKYEALKSGAKNASMGDDYFLLAGKMYDDWRFFEKHIQWDEQHWIYLRVEFQAHLSTAIDPLLQFVKSYPNEKYFLLRKF